jgi:FMN-dependent NADH-azoreductase
MLLLKNYRPAYPGSTVKETDLVNVHFPHLEEAHITSFFTPVENHTPENLAAAKHSDDAINDLKDADIIVIGAPMYNFSIHSALKAWVDHVVRKGITFKYDENGPEGLIKQKKVYVAITSGAVYSEGPMAAMDYVEPYLKTILGFIGLTDITIYRVEGTSIPGLQDNALEKGINSIQLN